MEVLVNNSKVGRLTIVTPKHAMFVFDLSEEDDRQACLDFLKSRRGKNPQSQMEIDAVTIACGGEPEHQFPGYENMTQ